MRWFSVIVMEYEKVLLQYALDNNKVGAEFFTERARAIIESAEDRMRQLAERNRINDLLLSNIAAERDEKQRKLQFIPPSYGARQASISRSIDALDREFRSEIVRHFKDSAALSKEIQEKIEEYRGLSSVFKGMAFTDRRSGGHDRREGEIRE